MNPWIIRLVRQPSLAVAIIGSLAAAPATAADGGLPAGAVVAFTPQTVCDKLPGGWTDYVDAAGRVVVGAAAGVPTSGPADAGPATADYWSKGVTLKSDNLPRVAVTGAGQIVVTSPETRARTAAAKEVFASDKPDAWLFGYRQGATGTGPSQSLPVGYGAPGAIGSEHPAPVLVAPPFVALRYCVKK